MSLSFLVPAFLAGLAALLVPVLIHLTRRQTRDAVEFPSLMFVRRVPHRSTNRRRIRNWPLFLLRCLAVAMIAVAFARPFLEREDAAAAGTTAGAREVVILLDRSYSMGFGDRWERARAAAAARIDSLGPRDRGTLVLFDSRGEALVQSSADRAALRAALDGAEWSPRATRYAPALRYAERVLAASTQPRHEVVVISDFQRNGWEQDAGEAGSIRLPAGTVVTPVAIGGGTGSNLTVASVAFRRTLAAGRERATATARLVNRGDAARTVPVVLEIDGRPVETRNVSLPAGGAASVEFAPVTLAERGITRGSVRAPEDALAADNAHHFALSPDQRLGVLVVGGEEDSYYLRSALAIGDQPGFRTTLRAPGGIRAADLVGNRVVVLDQAPLPGGEVGRRLREFVEQGGGLVILLGEGRMGGWAGALPDGAGRAVDRMGDGGVALGYVDLGHPAFEPFTAPRSGDFASARFFRYRELAASPDQRVLARFGDGGTALAEHRVGRGRVLVWSSPLDARWSDLPLQPVFLPFVHQLARYASGYAPARPAFTVGEPFDPGAVTASERYGLALAPSGARIPVEGGAPLSLDEPGFYELRDERSGERATAVAVNVDPAEADLAAVDPQEVVAALLPRADGRGAAAEPIALTLAEREQQQGAWWYLIIAGFALLVAETVASRVLGARARAVR